MGPRVGFLGKTAWCWADDDQQQQVEGFNLMFGPCSITCTDTCYCSALCRQPGNLFTTKIQKPSVGSIHTTNLWTPSVHKVLSWRVYTSSITLSDSYLLKFKAILNTRMESVITKNNMHAFSISFCDFFFLFFFFFSFSFGKHYKKITELFGNSS